MAGVHIKVRENGPYRIEGDVRLLDGEGREIDTSGQRLPLALCRCGGSTTKPFCDGTHSRIGFAAAERAVGKREC